MPLHLVKLCVGCDSVEDLEEWIEFRLKEQRRARRKPEHRHTTRMIPQRAGELLDGGSLYWVIRGNVQARQRLLAIRPFRDGDGIKRCHLVLEPKVVADRLAAAPRLPGLALPEAGGRAARHRRPRRAARAAARPPPQPRRSRPALVDSGDIVDAGRALLTAMLSISVCRAAAASSRSGSRRQSTTRASVSAFRDLEIIDREA